MIYDTDQIKYIAVTRDSVYGGMTEAAAVIYDCVVEDTNRIVKDANGQTITPNALILLDPDFSGVKGDIIQFYKQFGTTSTDTKKYEIIEVFTTGGMSASHKEVLI